MTAETPIQVSLKDPLSQVTRNERRMLLGLSVLSIFVARTGLIPSKISALGIELERTDQQAFLLVMAVVVGYFVAGFFLYGLTDFLAWRVLYNEGSKVAYMEFFKKVSRQRDPNDDHQQGYPQDWTSRWPNHFVMPASFLRAIFEFALPLAVGGYAVYALLSAIK